MHQIWAIEEVAAAILCLLHWSDQARMARVCRTLWATAIPLLWEELDDISALNAFLELEEGDGCGPNGTKDDLSVPPQCKSLLSNRVALHAQFIRKMLLDVDSEAYRIVELLSRTPFRESLTRLKSLELVVDSSSEPHDAAILFRAFYTPTLTHIEIVTDVPYEGVRAEPYQSFVQAITASHLPALRSLGLRAFYGRLADPFYLEEALRAHQQLEEVQIEAPDCTQEMLEILKNLPVLRTLVLGSPCRPDSSPRTPPALLVKGFPCLVSFDARPGIDLPTTKQVLASIGSDRMEVLKIWIYRSGASLEDRMDEMLDGLSRFKGLKEVELQLDIDIIWEDIQPVLACRGLTRFSLISWQSKWIPIDRTHLNAMTQAWPKLTHLAVTHKVHRLRTGSPQIKLADLLHITDSLPSIRSLCISFDARRDGQGDIFALVAAPSRGQLEWLDLGFSIKDDHLDADAQLGQLFTSWWPTLRELRIPQYCSQESWNPIIEFVRSAAGVALSP